MSEVRICKQHYVMIDSAMRDWLLGNVGHGSWVATDGDLPEGYEWGVWWCMGSGGVIFKRPADAIKFSMWLSPIDIKVQC